MKALMTGAVAAVLLASTAVQAQMKPEEMVETRQAGYQFMSWNMGKIKAQVVDGKEPYDQAKVAAAAVGSALKGQEPPKPSYINTCYSVAGTDHCFSIAGVYGYSAADNKIVELPDAGGISPLGASAEDLALTCHAHPTVSEAVREAALACGGGAIHA